MASPAPTAPHARASAPGKLILFGEHAVVYGKTAVAGALSDLRVFVRAVRREALPPSAGRHRTLARAHTGSHTGRRLDHQHPRLGEGGSRCGSDMASGKPRWACYAGSGCVWCVQRHCVPHATAPGMLRRWAPCADARKAVQPIPGVCEALESLCTEYDPLIRKAIIPTAFLALAMVGGHLRREGAKSATSCTGLAVHIESNTSTLPVAAGLGSSAAFSVATAAALLALFRQLQGKGMAGEPAGAAGAPHTPLAGEPVVVPSEASLSLINAWAYSAETLFHGAPSGLDNTVSTYGGAIAYRKSPQYIHRVQDMPQLPILVTNTKVPKDTKALVAGVRTRYDAHPTIVAPIIDAIEEVSNTFLEQVEHHAVTTADARRLMVGASADGSEIAHASSRGTSAHGSGGLSSPVPTDPGRPRVRTVSWDAAAGSLVADTQQLIHMNQGLLDALGVGHPAIDAVRATAARVLPGAATKLTGAGGGGCALTLLPEGVGAERGDALVQVLEQLSWASGKHGAHVPFVCVRTAMAGAGVLVEQPCLVSAAASAEQADSDVTTGVYVSRRRAALIAADKRRREERKHLTHFIVPLGLALSVGAGLLKSWLGKAAAPA